jgi:hypothetical protein
VSRPSHVPAGPIEHGFQITIWRPNGLTPPLLYEALVTLMGIRHHPDTPGPHIVERILLESDGVGLMMKIWTEDGTRYDVERNLERGIRGML